MKLDKRLNFVIPVERPDGTKDFVHASPIGEETFDKYFLIIGQAFSQMYAGGLGLFAGPRVAAKLVKKIAVDAGTWDGPEGIENGLFRDMRQRANFVSAGRPPIPFDDAVASGDLSAEDASEVENALAFFMVASSMHKRSELPTILTVVSRIWDAQTSSLNATEFSASLGTLTRAENTGAKAKASPIPV